MFIFRNWVNFTIILTPHIGQWWYWNTDAKYIHHNNTKGSLFYDWEIMFNNRILSQSKSSPSPILSQVQVTIQVQFQFQVKSSLNLNGIDLEWLILSNQASNPTKFYTGLWLNRLQLCSIYNRYLYSASRNMFSIEQNFPLSSSFATTEWKYILSVSVVFYLY